MYTKTKIDLYYSGTEIIQLKCYPWCKLNSSLRQYQAYFSHFLTLFRGQSRLKRNVKFFRYAVQKDTTEDFLKISSLRRRTTTILPLSPRSRMFSPTLTWPDSGLEEATCWPSSLRTPKVPAVQSPSTHSQLKKLKNIPVERHILQMWQGKKDITITY